MIVQWLANRVPRYFDEDSRIFSIGRLDETDASCIGGQLVTLGDDEDVRSTPHGADTYFDAVVVTSRMDEARREDTVTKAYNALRRGGLLAIETNDAGPQDVEEVFKGHGLALDQLFFDYGAWSVDGTKFFVAGIKMSETCCFLPEFDGGRLLMRSQKRTIAYVACTTPNEHEAAMEQFGDDPWRRVLFVPTSCYGHYGAYAHALPARYAEWCDAAYVAVVPFWLASEVDQLMGVNPTEGSWDVVSKHATRGNLVEDASARCPTFKDTFETVLVESGYKAFDIAAAPVDLGEVWMARPRWMTQYCDFLTKVRGAMDAAPRGIQADLWAPIPESASVHWEPDEEKLRMWGTIKEPHHRLIASKMPGFCFWVKNAVVMSLE